MSAAKNAALAAEEEKLLNLVATMNELNECIDPDYAKMAVFLPVKNEAGETVKAKRYFIKKRTYTDVNGVQRWKFIAREGDDC